MTQLLRLSGPFGDHFQLRLPAGQRVQVTVVDLDAAGSEAPVAPYLRADMGTAPGSLRLLYAGGALAGDSARLVLQSDVDDRVTLHAYGSPGHQVAMTALALGADDHGDSPGSATQARVGQDVDLRIDAGGDRDLLAFDLSAGERVVFDAGTPELWLQVVDGPGAPFAEGLGTLALTPEHGGRVLLQVRHLTGGGEVSAVLRSWHQLDDHADLVDAASPLEFGRAVTGVQDQPGDVDQFRLEAAAGQQVQLRVAAAGWLPGLQLLDASRQWIPSEAGLEPDGGDYLVCFRMPAEGLAWVGVTSFGNEGAPYELLATPVIADDHGARIDDATPIHPGQTLPAFRESAADVDVFRWQAQAGQRYRIVVEMDQGVDVGAMLYAGSVSDWPGPPLTAAGNGASTLSSSFTAQTAGDFWLQLSGSRATASTVTLLAEPEIDVADRSEPGGLLIPGEAVAGLTSTGSDRDTFRLQARAGEPVQLSLRVTDGLGSWRAGLGLYSDSGVCLGQVGLDEAGTLLEWPSWRSDLDRELTVVVSSFDAWPRSYLLKAEPGVAFADTRGVDHGELTISLVGLSDAADSLPLLLPWP